MRSKTTEIIGEGINPKVHEDLRIISKGRVLRDTKDKTIIIKAFTEEDLINIKHMVLDKMKNAK